jgi:hypothetical protein
MKTDLRVDHIKALKDRNDSLFNENTIPGFSRVTTKWFEKKSPIMRFHFDRLSKQSE